MEFPCHPFDESIAKTAGVFSLGSGFFCAALSGKPFKRPTPKFNSGNCVQKVTVTPMPSHWNHTDSLFGCAYNRLR
jgi:hypothetical protein